MKRKTIFKNKITSIQRPSEFNSTFNSILFEINAYHKKIQFHTDNQLIKLSMELKKNSQSTNISELIIQAYSLVKEVCSRKLRITPFDVQILGAIALNEGNLIEMQTGEGKTLVAAFAAYLNAIIDEHVHILTFNDYLAERDAKWMLPIYNFLGITVDFVNESMNRIHKKKAYSSNITYATAKEVGFDYLRSLIDYDKKDRVIQFFKCAIVDEADAILIDEARNPLVLAGNLFKVGVDFIQIANFVNSLIYDIDFKTDEYSRNIYLTKKGIDKVESTYMISNLYSDSNLELHSALNLALQARTLLKKDVDYIVRDGQIKLVDEFTGRIVEDRKWKNGIQSAVEAKENLNINSEGSILNSITLQNLMRKYSKLSGMTATAKEAAEEFEYFYNLKTVIIPSNKNCARVDHPDLIFNTKEEKYRAIVQEVIRVHEKGQPILVGTLTVKESEELSNIFKKRNLICEVLNAKNDRIEADIIAKAGMMNAVTISTNMAGRGTDIILGGVNKVEKEELEKMGGLYVIGTNKHESMRIDRQLRGRAGRQGDAGSSRFFVSLEDDLMIKYNLKDALPKKKIKKNSLIDSMSHIQRVIEGQMYDLRRFLYDYSSLIEKQRIIIQNERERILSDDKLPINIKVAILFYYDKFWSIHLDYLSELKEGIHFLRVGGLNPLREFQKKADIAFKEMFKNLDREIKFTNKYFRDNPESNPSSLGIKKPSSTWTYVINDYPFGNQLGIMLLNNSNIGFQVDVLSITILFFYRLIKKKLHKSNYDEEDLY
jgi:preprotein translocase subunit SecA